MDSAPKPRNVPLWIEASPDALRYPPLSSKVAADVAVIGGGIVGVMAAWRLASGGKSVVLLEKNRVAAGDTGCTTAMITRVPDVAAAKLKSRYGAAFLKMLFEATAAAERRLVETIRKENIDCGYGPCSSFHCSYRPNDPMLLEEWEALKDAGTGAEWLTENAATTAGAPIAEAIRFAGEGRFDARKFLLELLKRPTAGSIRVFEESEAAGVEVGRRVTVKTRGGEVEAGRLIVATGLPSGAFAELHPLFTPRLTYVVVARYPEAAPISDNVFWDTDDPYQYYRLVGGRTVMLGGADRDAGAAPPAGSLPPHQKLTDFLDRRFPGRYEITHAWSGSLFFTEDGLPYAAAHPHYKGKVVIASGFGGNGMVMGTLAGTIAADLALGRKHPHAELLSFKRTGANIKPQTSNFKRFDAVLRWGVPLAYLVTLFIPGYVFFSVRGGVSFLSGMDFRTLRLSIFPLIGLYAFFLVWAQIMLGANMPYLRRAIPWVEKFHRAEGVFALLFALTHPIFLATGLGLETYLKIGFVDPRYKIFVLLGDLQLFLIILTAATALMMKHPWFRNRWHYIHYANYAVFAMVWTHSWFLGSDVRPTNLKYLWYFFAATAAASLAGRLRRAFAPKRASLKTLTTQTSMNFARIASINDVQEGKPFCAAVGDKKIAVFKIGGAYYAMNNVCSHAGGPLCDGALDGKTIECPWHGSKFDATTGNVLAGPAAAPQETYEVKIEGGEVLIKI